MRPSPITETAASSRPERRLLGRREADARAPYSALRLSALDRLLVASALVAGLWVAVFWALR